MHKITSLQLLRTPILCFSATKQIMRMRGPQKLKNFFLIEKKLLNAILRAKLKYMKKKFFLMNEQVFLAMQRQIFMCFSFLQKKSF